MNVDRLVDACYDSIPLTWRQKPWEHLNHGKAVLDSEELLNAYIAAYGEMHIVKCRMAMQNFPFEDLVFSRNDNGEITRLKNFELYDWGCGQGIGSLVFLQMLHERDMLHGLRRITLVEPSKTAISRAELWVRQAANASTDIRVVNRFIPANDDPMWTDIDCQTSIAIHICSNILDINEVGLKWLAQTTSNISHHNIYICVGPQFGQGISRISDFHKCLGEPACFTDFSRYPCAYTSKTRHPFGIEAKCFTLDSINGFNSEYVEQSKQIHIDEYQSGDECLKGILPDSIISAYHALLEATKRDSFELYLRPSIGIERPDFVLANMSRGIVVINVCNDISKFAEDYDRIEAIKQAIIDTYIKSLKIGTIITPSTYNAIKVGLYFDSSNFEEIESACATYYQEILAKWEETEKAREEKFKNEGREYKRGVQPSDSTRYLVKINRENCLSEINSITCRGFRYDFFSELKSLILGRWHTYSQGDTTLRLTKRQDDLVESESSRLRIKGVAGCGKTQIVAHKAVKEHIRTGTKVLIVTYNISLICYIRMRINLVPADFSTDAFEIINYHQFFISKARKYHGSHIPFGASDNARFFEPYLDDIRRNKDQYDTIIVDEAQDYTPAWFDCLRLYFLSENGRIILCGDGEQNIYSREVESTTKLPMVRGFGQNNPWRNVSQRVSMRMLNPKIAILSSQFAQEFNISTEELSIQQDDLNLFDYKIGYWHVNPAVSPDTIAGNIEWVIRQFNLNSKDVVILGQTINLLRVVDYHLRSNFSHKTMTTFESKEEYEEIKSQIYSPAKLELDLKAIRRVAKVHFTTDVDCLKLATIQSFKGWESKSIILLIQPERDSVESINEDDLTLKTRQNIPAQLYTAITRARENLFILNLGNQKFHNFFNSKIKND